MASKKANKNGQFVSNEDFVTAHTKADNADEVASALGMDRKQVLMRAYTLRKKGVNLKKYPGSRVRVNVDALNELVEENS